MHQQSDWIVLVSTNLVGFAKAEHQIKLLDKPEAEDLFDATAIICLRFYYFDSELVVGQIIFILIWPSAIGLISLHINLSSGIFNSINRTTRLRK